MEKHAKSFSFFRKAEGKEKQKEGKGGERDSAGHMGKVRKKKKEFLIGGEGEGAGANEVIYIIRNLGVFSFLFFFLLHLDEKREGKKREGC